MRDNSHALKIITVLFLAVASLSAADLPQTFTESRVVQHSFDAVKAAVTNYCSAARTNHSALWIGGTHQEKAGRFVQTWIDCAGAPPGALMGEIIVTREPGPQTGTRLEVRTGATRTQNTNAAERRRKRTKKALEEIVALLERKP